MKKNSQEKAMRLQVGDKVVCVRSSENDSFSQKVTAGRIYTIVQLDDYFMFSEKEASRYRWSKSRFLPLSSLMKELL